MSLGLLSQETLRPCGHSPVGAPPLEEPSADNIKRKRAKTKETKPEAQTFQMTGRKCGGLREFKKDY